MHNIASTTCRALASTLLCVFSQGNALRMRYASPSSKEWHTSRSRLDIANNMHTTSQVLRRGAEHATVPHITQEGHTYSRLPPPAACDTSSTPHPWKTVSAKVWVLGTRCPTQQDASAAHKAHNTQHTPVEHGQGAGTANIAAAGTGRGHTGCKHQQKGPPLQKGGLLQGGRVCRLLTLLWYRVLGGG